MHNQQYISCVGEVLWDALPSGLYLGGAPLNVCLHLHELGEQSLMVSRVGSDRLGDEALARIKRHGISTDYIQVDKEYETGFVRVTIDSEDTPEYEIIEPTAWDFIDLSQPELINMLENSWAVVFGSLAQRRNTSLRNLLNLDCLKVLDMNLRSPHYDEEEVKSIIKHCDIIKMNDQELKLLQKWLGLSKNVEEAVREIYLSHHCQTVCVTRGEHGSVLLHRGEYFEHSGYAVEVVDAVGAGDAFLAALLHALKSGKSQKELLPFSNAVGAYVARQSGANPAYSISDIESVIRS